MAVTLVNATGMQFGVGSDETGLQVESVDFNYMNDEVFRLSRQGEHEGFAHKNPRCEITINGETGTAGLASATLAATITVANLISAHGVSTGGVYVTEVIETYSREDWNKLTINAIRHPGIT